MEMPVRAAQVRATPQQPGSEHAGLRAMRQASHRRRPMGCAWTARHRLIPFRVAVRPILQPHIELIFLRDPPGGAVGALAREARPIPTADLVTRLMTRTPRDGAVRRGTG
jgi:hypothetical protein